MLLQGCNFVVGFRACGWLIAWEEVLCVRGSGVSWKLGSDSVEEEKGKGRGRARSAAALGTELEQTVISPSFSFAISCIP